MYHTSRHLAQAYANDVLKQIFQFGHSGVDLFFVISGFIILYVHYGDVGQPRRAARYVERRVTRLVPTYWVALAITIGLSTLGHLPLAVGPTLAWQALLLPSDQPMALGIAWTLRFEALFYAMFWVLILNRRIGLGLMLLWFIGAATLAGLGNHLNWLPGQFSSGYVLEFMLGMIVAYLTRNHKITLAWAVFATGLLLFAVAAMSEDAGLLDGYSDLARVAYGAPSALVVLGIAALSKEGAPPAVPWLFRTLGSASYSLYLFQFVFIGATWQLLLKTGLAQPSTMLPQFLILTGGAIVGGVIVSKGVEFPLIRLCRSLTAPHVAQAPVR
jgi:exopolysaccharide production protein ExoZ